MAAAPPGLKDPEAHGMQSDELRDPERELLVPAGQGVESPEPSGQKQPRAQGVGGDEDAGRQKDPAGQRWQPPVPLMKKPDRQPETRISTTLEGTPWPCPPPNRARFETDVAAREYRATLNVAVVHNPEVTLKISTTLEKKP